MRPFGGTLLLKDMSSVSTGRSGHGSCRSRQLSAPARLPEAGFRPYPPRGAGCLLAHARRHPITKLQTRHQLSVSAGASAAKAPADRGGRADTSPAERGRISSHIMHLHDDDALPSAIKARSAKRPTRTARRFMVPFRSNSDSRLWIAKERLNHAWPDRLYLRHPCHRQQARNGMLSSLSGASLDGENRVRFS